jgi:hypothetical protein
MCLEELNEFRIIFDSIRFNSDRVKKLHEGIVIEKVEGEDGK